MYKRQLYHSETAGLYLRLFSPLVVVLFMDTLVDGMHKGLGEQVYCVRVNTLTNLLDVVFLFLLLPRFGIAGYFFTFTLTHFLNFYLSLAHLLTVTGYTPRFSYICKVLLCTVAAALAAGTTAALALPSLLACLLALAVFGVVFGVLLLSTAAWTAPDTRWLRSVTGCRSLH